MNERQCKYIIAISEERNITAAAHKLFISQPSLSYLLSHVEEELGTKLFDRNVTPLALTDAGECCVEAAKQLLNIQRELKNQIDDIRQLRKGHLTIGCSPRLSPILFPALLPSFIRNNPGIQLTLVEENIPVLEDMLAYGDLEVAFSNTPMTSKDFGHVTLFHEELLLLAPASFIPQAVEKDEKHTYPTLELSCAQDYPFVLLKPHHRLRQMIDKVFSDHDIKPRIICETDNWETCFGMVTQGIAFTILPYSPLQRVVWTDTTVKEYGIKGEYDRQLSLYYRKNTHRLALIESFIRSTQSIISDSQKEARG